MADLKKVFGREVRARRMAAGKTQAQLADQINRSVDAVGQIERGEIAASFDTIAAISKALSATPAELFGGKPRSPNERDRTVARILDKLLDATPAQLKRVARVIDGLVDE